jgi:hypothetical protein
MIITIHQPEYFPYLGFFDRLLKSDVLVLLDDVQFQRGYINRNRVRTPEGWQWLTVPVIGHGRLNPINSIQIDPNINWQEQHCKILELNYGRAAHFHDFFPAIKKILTQNWQTISDLDIALLKELFEIFNIKIKIEKSSALKTEGKSTELLISICKALGGDTYLSGPGGKNYMDMDLFDKANIKVTFQDFVHPIYKQQFAGEFQPYMACIDYLFNYGPNLNF